MPPPSAPLIVLCGCLSKSSGGWYPRLSCSFWRAFGSRCFVETEVPRFGSPVTGDDGSGIPLLFLAGADLGGALGCGVFALAGEALVAAALAGEFLLLLIGDVGKSLSLDH